MRTTINKMVLLASVAGALLISGCSEAEQSSFDTISVNNTQSLSDAGGNFQQQAESLFIITALMESPGNFYQRIRVCRMQQYKDESTSACKRFLETVERGLSSFNADRKKISLQQLMGGISASLQMTREQIEKNDSITHSTSNRPKPTQEE